MAGRQALLLIDAQVNMFDPQSPVDRAAELLETLAGLLGRARAAGAPVVFVQNCGGPDDPDAPGSPGWAIHPRLAPLPGEPVVQKTTPDSFHGTELQAELARLGASRLVVAGMQSEYCVDTTCRRASSLGYGVTLVGDGHSTYDTPLLPAATVAAHHTRVLRAFAAVAPAADVRFEG